MAFITIVKFTNPSQHTVDCKVRNVKKYVRGFGMNSGSVIYNYIKFIYALILRKNVL